MRVTNEEGSILVSTFLLLLFISFLLTSMTLIIRHQQIQMRQFSYSYEAKSMLQMTEQLIKERADDKQKEGTIQFSNGTVTVKTLEDNEIELHAVLNNNYTSQMILTLDSTEEVEQEETEEEIESLMEKHLLNE